MSSAPGLERLAEAVAQVAVLAGGDRRARRRRDPAQRRHVLGRDGVLEPEQAERLELVREPQGVGDLVAPVAVEGDVDLVADRVDHRGGELDHEPISARLSVPAEVSCMYGVGTSRSNLSALKPCSATTSRARAGVQLGGEQVVRRGLGEGAAVLGRADRAGGDRLGRLLRPARRARDHRRVHRLQRLARRGSRRRCGSRRGTGRRAGGGSGRRRAGR